MIVAEHKRVRPLVMLYPWISRCWAKAKARKATAIRRAKANAKASKANTAKTRRTRTKTRTAKGKGKGSAKTTKHFPGYCLVCKASRHAMKDCWWNVSAKSGKDTASLQTTITPAANATTESSITGS